MWASDWTLKTDDELALIASEAFKLGLQDGRELSGPRDSHAVLESLRSMSFNALGDNLAMHRIKMRQVYGAGFDIARLTKP